MDDNQKKQLLSGLFVLSGIILLLVLLFFLGLSDFFTEKVPLRTGFVESVQGLSRGSPVKYRGVQIGTVSGISILVSQNIIQVDMEIEPRYFFNERKGKSNYTKGEFDNFMRSEIREKGLRARLEMLGITGMKYIDFDYFAPPEKTQKSDGTGGQDSTGTPDRAFDEKEKAGVRRPGADFDPAGNARSGTSALFVPSVTSQMKDFTATLTEAVDRISKIRYEQISERLESALVGLGQLLNSQEIRSTISRINETAENLERVTRSVSSALSEERVKGVMELLEQNLQQLHKLQNSIVSTTNEAKLPETSEAFRRAMNTFSDSRKELANTMMKLDQTLEALRVLADVLSADPASLVRGRKEDSRR